MIQCDATADTVKTGWVWVEMLRCCELCGFCLDCHCLDGLSQYRVRVFCFFFPAIVSSMSAPMSASCALLFSSAFMSYRSIYGHYIQFNIGITGHLPGTDLPFKYHQICALSLTLSIRKRAIFCTVLVASGMTPAMRGNSCNAAPFVTSNE